MLSMILKLHLTEW